MTDPIVDLLGRSLPPIHRFPTAFRLSSIEYGYGGHGPYEAVAHLYHAQASLRVRYPTRSIDERLQANGMVSARWGRESRCERGCVEIARLVALARSLPSVDLLSTVPSGWVEDATLLARARDLVLGLPPSLQALFNEVMWDGQRFRRFCTGPSSITGHHDGPNGNLRHAVEVAEELQARCASRAYAHAGVGVLAALLHDAGKADEYVLGPDGHFRLSDRGRLLGHRVTVVEWLAVARSRLDAWEVPEAEYTALLHCLTALPHMPAWSGIRAPVSVEAILLSLADRLSGVDDLLRRCAASDGGWGRYHPHLKGRPFSVVESEPE